MAYNDDAVLAKLSSLSETQDSIVSVAQWIMFYRYSDPGVYSNIVKTGFCPTRCLSLHTNWLLAGVMQTAQFSSGYRN